MVQPGRIDWHDSRGGLEEGQVSRRSRIGHRHSPELKAKLGAFGLYSSVGICGTDFARLLRKQYDEFGRVIREVNVKAE